MSKIIQEMRVASFHARKEPLVLERGLSRPQSKFRRLGKEISVTLNEN
jgi:hypothetical protein